jgi:hypothetical protein
MLRKLTLVNNTLNLNGAAFVNAGGSVYVLSGTVLTGGRPEARPPEVQPLTYQ